MNGHEHSSGALGQVKGSEGRKALATLGRAIASLQGTALPARLLTGAARLAGFLAIITVGTDIAEGRRVSPVVLLVSAVGGVACLYIARRRDGKVLGLWAAYILGFTLMVSFRGLADETGMPVHAAYAVQADKLLFGGMFPSDWLQAHLYRPGHVGVLGAYSMLVYTSYFVVPHAVAFLLWLRDKQAFRRYAISFLLLLGAGLAAFFALPTAPPWLASSFTHAPKVTRMFVDVFGQAEVSVNTASAGNAVAAMPSFHMAMTMLVVAALWRRRLIVRLVLVLYALSMAFALVFLGEHYVVDEIAGAAIAVAAWKISPRLVDSRLLSGLRKRPPAAEPA